MKFVALVVLVLCIVLAVVLMIGARLPRDHVARVERLVPAPRHVVARFIADIDRYPSWRRGVTAIEDEVVEGSVRTYVEVSGGERVRYRSAVLAPERSYHSTIADSTLPYGGTWTTELSDRTGGTLVTIEERGFVNPPLFRVISRYVIGQTSSMNNYLDDLSQAIRDRTP